MLKVLKLYYLDFRRLVLMSTVNTELSPRVKMIVDNVGSGPAESSSWCAGRTGGTGGPSPVTPRLRHGHQASNCQ